MSKKKPARLYKKEEPKKLPPFNPIIFVFIIVIISFIFGILLAIACKSPYNMVWA